MQWRPDPPSPDIIEGALDQVPRRALTASAFWNRLRPRLADFGISRVADITGLDHLGFPVAQAVRPWARSNAVTQGKATRLEAAALGAVLECLEMAAGEDLSRLPSVPGVNHDAWRPLAPDAHWPISETSFVPAWSLTEAKTVPVPRDLLSTDFSRGAEAERAPILRHSIGLGAGSDFASALFHALLEAIEADARLRAEAAGSERRVALNAADEEYGPLLSRITKTGARVAVFDLSRLHGICVVQASVMDAPGASALPLPAVGYAARPSPSASVAAALAEAVQARLAMISGAREDLTQRFYAHKTDPVLLDQAWAAHGPAPSTDLTTVPRDWTVRALAQAVGPVYALPLHWDPDLPLAIVRVLAPNLISDPLRLGAI